MIEKFWIRAMIYGIVVLAAPVLLACHFLDSLIETAYDVKELWGHARERISRVPSKD